MFHPDAIMRWLDDNAVGKAGEPLQPWQRELVERSLSGRPLVIVHPRRPYRVEEDFVAAVLLLMMAGGPERAG